MATCIPPSHPSPFDPDLIVGVLIVMGSKNLYKLGGVVRLWGAMRTIAHFLTRKRVASTSAALAVPRLSKAGPLRAEDRSEPTLADIATRVGGENEELRNLLIEADRRIGALDDLRDVFRNLAEPMGSALQALEQEKADNVTLRNSLAELRAAHESVCSEFSALEKRAAELESEGDELRRQLALAQEAACRFERDKTELTNEIVAVRAELANIDSQLAQETAHGRALSEANQILVDHASSADKRIVELQSEGALMREKLVSLENEKRSLQTALDQTLAERSRLSRRLIESENALTASRARLEQMDISLAAAENERATLTTERDEANERHQSEAYALNLQLEALSSRAATTEELLSQIRGTVVTRTEEVRSLERKVVEATIARNATEKGIERLTAARDALDGKTRELEQERASLMERCNSLAETLKTRETSLTHAGEKIKSLTDRIAEIEANAGSYRAKTDRRIDELNESLQRERVELAVAQGALETARRDYARLQRDMLAGHEAPRRGRSPRLEEVSKEPLNLRNGGGDGRGPKSVEAEPEVGGAAEPSSTR
jgi:crescentin